jgi:hypothetical protein
MEPTTPALHCSITSFGLLRMNIGEAITGKGTFCKTGGNMTSEPLLLLKTAGEVASTGMTH